MEASRHSPNTLHHHHRSQSKGFSLLMFEIVRIMLRSSSCKGPLSREFGSLAKRWDGSGTSDAISPIAVLTLTLQASMGRGETLKGSFTLNSKRMDKVVWSRRLTALKQKKGRGWLVREYVSISLTEIGSNWEFSSWPFLLTRAVKHQPRKHIDPHNKSCGIIGSLSFRCAPPAICITL